MTRPLVRSTSMRFSARRTATLAVVMVAHVGLLAFLTRAPLPLFDGPDSAPRQREGALQVTLLQASSRPLPTLREPRGRKRRAQTPVPTAPRPNTKPPTRTPAANARHEAREETSAGASIPEDPAGLATPAQPQSYIAGGRGFAEALHAPPPAMPRLPGDASATRFRMVDPRSRGLSGVVRFIGSLTGAVDPACLDLEAWRGMTPAERIEHHVSPRDIEQAAASHRCTPQRAGWPRG